MPYNVVIPQYITPAGKDFLINKGYHVIDGYEITTVKQLKEIVSEAHAILARTALFTKEVIDSAPKLKVISRQGVGYENIDVDYCTSKGIWVTYAPKANFNAVAEHVIGLILAASHNIVTMDKQVHKGNWLLRNEKKGNDIANKTLGIIGFGRIGSCLAKKAAFGLEMNIIAYDYYLPQGQFPQFVTVANSLDELLSKSDIVSLHMPLNSNTNNMVNKSFLAKMKPSAILINCARGEIISENDLYDALKNGVIRCAAVDVMAKEPPELNNPLLQLEEFIVTPHNAALTTETMDRMGLHAAMGIDEVLSGRRPQWPVNSI